MDEWIGQAIALALFFIGIGFFASIETALAGVPEARVRLAHEKKLSNAQYLWFWIESPARVLTTLHLLRLCCVAAVVVLVVDLLDALDLDLHRALLVGLLGIGALVFGHLLPRVIAKRHALAWSLLTIRIVKALTVIGSPLTALVIWPTGWLGRLIGVPREEHQSLAFWTPDEVDKLTESARADSLGEASEDLYRSIIEFSDTVIREIMVPRTEMVALAVGSPLDEARLCAVEAGHSRIPVYEDTIDNILGLLYVKDLSAAPPTNSDGGFSLRAMVRPTFYVPEVMKISELLREFQRRKTHMAIVVDEYGGTAGLVTLEDIIEEIVGEIQDEYDVEEKQFRVIGEKIIADGRVRLWDLEEPLGVEFPENGGYESLAGFITARAGYLPAPGTVVSWDGLIFTVKEANEKRIGTVEIERRKGELSQAPRHEPKTH